MVCFPAGFPVMAVAAGPPDPSGYDVVEQTRLLDEAAARAASRIRAYPCWPARST
jgi:hypothetical protein